ncbi:hypothetical protein LMH87_006091 [Akanthomyces muscarius]|uniref:Uncharacterized protein n=1 Tax=Akanthomyces muscarius TaxID=2231603 RepID=A0A9W8QN63_AKAMU|nr:hypothetical protein LMH87_006091 [Akanthomyces muscarius]KAJ4164415.1 hypothetical protein LMH87_006091 [Akanthomyces muscarius]
MQPGYARDYALGSHRDGQIGAKSQAQRYPSDAPLVKRGGRANKPNQVLLVSRWVFKTGGSSCRGRITLGSCWRAH